MRIERLSLFLAGAILLAASLRAEQPEGNALIILDAYLAQAALTTPRYRTDLQAGGDPGTVPPGRRFGEAPLLGPFTYRPKTYTELTSAERTALWRDPKLRPFLIAAAQRPAPAKTHPATDQLRLSPEEMLRSRPVFIVLPPPSQPP